MVWGPQQTQGYARVWLGRRVEAAGKRLEWCEIGSNPGQGLGRGWWCWVFLVVMSFDQVIPVVVLGGIDRPGWTGWVGRGPGGLEGQSTPQSQK